MAIIKITDNNPISPVIKITNASNVEIIRKIQTSSIFTPKSDINKNC